MLVTSIFKQDDELNSGSVTMTSAGVFGVFTATFRADYYNRQYVICTVKFTIIYSRLGITGVPEPHAKKKNSEFFMAMFMSSIVIMLIT